MDEVLELYNNYMLKIENLARRLLETKPRTADYLWDFEKDLAKLQVEIQQRALEEKKARQGYASIERNIASNKTGNWKNKIIEVQGQIKRADAVIQIYLHALLICPFAEMVLTFLNFRPAVSKQRRIVQAVP